MGPRIVAIGALALLVGCHGLVGGGGDAGTDGAGGGGGGNHDGGAGADGGVFCENVSPAATVFANSCALRGGCHTAGGQYPDLSFSRLGDLIDAPSRVAPGERLVVPGEPSRSFLYRKMTGAQGPSGGLLMPVGSSQPIEGVGAIEAWIRAGAPTQCDGLVVPTPPRDPNTLDQGELFTCRPAPASSPARLRRVERAEWTHATGHTLRSLANDNPFYAAPGHYSTHSDGVSIDSATLDLYLLTVPEAARMWSARDPGTSYRLYSVYNDAALRCMFTDAAPAGACVDHYVNQLLSVGTLFRTPTGGERDRLRSLLVSTVAAEGGVENRRRSLGHVVSAAWLTSGALFRSEVGEPAPGDAAGRRRLTNDELALALGGVLSTHPPGSSLPASSAEMPGEPDRSAPADGWLGRIRRAAVDGSIQRPEVIRELLRAYRGGVDPSRADIRYDNDDRDLPARGEHWLAPRIAGFFREWLDYGGANSAFKDAPAATSAWHGQSSVERSYANLQRSYYGYESTLVAQLDDTIARAVLDAESRGEDVFRALFTTRTWRLPSNVAAAGTSYSASTSQMHRVYGMTEDVPATPEGRWVEMPAAGPRAGVLTHPAWLAAHGGNFEDDASAVLRGHWIREHLYCQTVPGLDLVMVEAQLVPSAPELRARDRIRASIEEGPQSATCMGCHRLMNSLGMPFEVFNHAGFERAQDHGRPPDGSSRVDVAPDPSLAGEVRDAVELERMIAASPYARRCFVRHAFRYFAGRDETPADACALAAMESAFARGSFFAMLEALVTSDTFLYRHVEEGSP